MTLTSGTRLGPYEILAPIGAGGMGEVYRARDTRLDRTVAIKVLSDRLSSSEEGRQRFEREAKTISQLSHPHICALHDVGREGDIEYLVMEYLEGETLSERLVKSPLALEQTLRYGVQIADALDKAHRQGIVHRDLKPGNVMLTKSGVKLLDFGLAKAIAPETSSGMTAIPTQANLTQEGAIVGTFQYMAPEQLEGRVADARTDIFALGAVLYEMATGRKAFSGSTQASLISSILRDEPQPISLVQPTSPPAFDRVVKTCLAKDPEDRWQSAHDVASELKWISEGSQAGAPPAAAPRRRNRERLAWAIAVLGVGIGLLASLLWRRTAAPKELVRFTIAPPPGQRFVDTVSLAPDGKRVLFVLQDPGGLSSLWVRPLGGLVPKKLSGTEEARSPFWSSDGRDIAFFSGGKLRRIGAEGGPAQTVCDSGSGFTGSWNRQGTILFTKEFGTAIVAVSAAGGTARPVTALDGARGEVAHFYPSFLPDGRHFVYVARNLDPEKTSIMLGSLDDAKDVRLLGRADSAALYADPGYLLFARDNALVAWKFDADRLRTLGEASPVFENVRYGTEDNRLVASAAGDSLAYQLRSQRNRLVWVDRKGRELGTLGAVGAYEDVRISPDGRRIAVAIRDSSQGQNQDVWVLDAARGTGTRVTADRTDEFSPAWFPDGDRLVYVSDRFGFYDLFERSASGGPEKILLRTKLDKILPSVSPDGRSVIYVLAEGATYSLFLAPVSGPGDPRRIGGVSRFSAEHPEISPDGRWVAFESSESGQREIYVQGLSDGPKRQVSVGGGQTAIWRRDGQELYYCARDGMLMSVAVRSRSDLPEVGEPQPLFPTQQVVAGVQFFRRPYDVAPDGQRFLVIRRAVDAEPDDAVVVLNWTAALTGAR